MFSIKIVLDTQKIQTCHQNTLASDGQQLIPVITLSPIRNKWRRDGEKLKPLFLCTKLTTYMRMLTSRMISELTCIPVLDPLTCIPPSRVTVLSIIPTLVELAEKKILEEPSIPLLPELLEQRKLKEASASTIAWQIRIHTRHQLLIWLSKVNKDLKEVKQPKDSTLSSQSTDQKAMECQTLQMTFLLNGKGKQRFMVLKIQCTKHSTPVIRFGTMPSHSINTVK